VQFPFLRRNGRVLKVAACRGWRGSGGNKVVLKLWKKLDNPFLLAAEGFVAGAILFWAVAPNSDPNEKAMAKPSAAAQMVSPSDQVASPIERVGTR
jgi:hypothetical protein